MRKQLVWLMASASSLCRPRKQPRAGVGGEGLELASRLGHGTTDRIIMDTTAIGISLTDITVIGIGQTRTIGIGLGPTTAIVATAITETGDM